MQRNLLFAFKMIYILIWKLFFFSPVLVPPRDQLKQVRNLAVKTAVNLYTVLLQPII